MGQKISEDGPESHQAKAGTPAMGGLIIILGILVGVFPSLRDKFVRPDMLAVLILMLAYSLLGFLDDYLTIRPVRGIRGISSKPKAALQFLLAIGFVYWLSTTGHQMCLRAFGANIISGIWYQIFAVLFIVGLSNFVNITDGLDGLVTGLSFLACIPLLAGMAAYAFTPMLLAIMGACLGFLWFNTNPAKIFMGDTGSLALGSAFAGIALTSHAEIVMIVGGLVFILDGLSSALQWAVFKYTRITTGTGRRVFLKSPVHHHFELSGWPEQLVVIRFWICGVVAASIAIIGVSSGWW